MKLMSIATALGGIGLGAALTVSLMPPPVEPPPPVVEITVDEYEPRWTLPGGTPEEQYVLEQLQEHTRITDPNALATILGNIKQESKFIPNICEGGARVSYRDCTRGGYGLIQWTSVNRYDNLGRFCDTYEVSQNLPRLS